MYEQFFGLTEKPFSLTPNPRFVFQSEQYRAAEEAILYGIRQKEGFMLVTGAPGTGKTTLCRGILEKLDPEKHRVALLFNPFLSGVEMLQAVLSEFGLGDTDTTSRKELLDRLNTYLLQQLANGHTCIAIFDEAQHLSTEFLEQIRVLSNLETDTEKLIQIILVGQPELLSLIRTPQMAQLDQRVSVRCTMTHMSREETGRYVYHRLNVAGSQGRIRFQEGAVRLLHAATTGVPRLVNLAADRSLLAGYTVNSRNISEVHVKQALASLGGEEGIADPAAAKAATLLTMPRDARWWMRRLAAPVLAVLLAVAWWQLDFTAEYLAFRAARSTSASAAETDYSRIASSHARSRQRQNALLRVAQLQIARGANDEGLRALDELGRDFPDAAISDRWLWVARAQMAKNDTAASCAAVAHVSDSDISRLGDDFKAIATECTGYRARAAAPDSTRRTAEATAPGQVP